MSLLETYRPGQKEDVQRCRSRVKNILEWMVGPRDALIKVALDALFEIPSEWTAEQLAIKEAKAAAKKNLKEAPMG